MSSPFAARGAALRFPPDGLRSGAFPRISRVHAGGVEGGIVWRFGRFVVVFSADSCVFSMDSHRLAPFEQESGSFQGSKTKAIALFSWEFAFLTPRCHTPVFGKHHLRLEIPLFLHF
jgi:hypothetical protein